MDTYRSTMFPIYLAILIIFWIGFSDFIRISCIINNPDAILKEKKRKIPRITLTCIACMYLYLSAVALRMFFFSDSLWNGTHIFAFTFWLIVPCVLSFLNLITVQKLCSLGMTQQVKRSWIGLKLSFLPFLLLNAWLVLHSTDYINPKIIGFACVVVILLPIFLLLLSLPMFILPLAINAMYGGVGAKYLRNLSQQTGNNCHPYEEHCIPQMFPGLDLISMLLILTKYKESSLDTKVSETDSVTVQSPCTAQSPYPAKTAPATKLTIYKKIEKYRKIFFLLYLLCGILFYFRSELVESTDEVYEDPADLAVSSILHGEYVAGPRFVDVYIAANGKTADECKRQKEALSEIFRCIELPVKRYTVYYYKLTVQEISMGDLNPGSAIAAFSIYP